MKAMDLYAQVDARWRWSTLAWPLAGMTIGAVHRFDEWGTVFNRVHWPFNGTWLATSVQGLALLPVAILMARHIQLRRSSWADLSRVMLIDAGVAIFSAGWMWMTARTLNGFAFGFAGASVLAVAGQAAQVAWGRKKQGPYPSCEID